MVKVVRMHFYDEQTMFEWIRDIFQKFGEAFNRNIYISVKIQDGKSPKNELSGKYCYVSTNGNADMFVRKEFIPGLKKSQFHLLYRDGFWFITNEEYDVRQKSNEIEGYVRLKTTELNHLQLSTSWNVLGSQEGTTTATDIAQKWLRHNLVDVLATVKIFSNEEEYKKYHAP